MQDARQSRIATALNLFERLARLVVSKPEKLKISADITSVAVNLDITIHPDDYVTIVGTGRKNLVKMEYLLRLMLAGTGMDFYIPDVTDTGEPKSRLREWVNPNWPKEKVSRLMLELARACFPNDRVALEVKDVPAMNGVSERTRLNFLFESADVDKDLWFVNAVSKLMQPCGKVCGRRIVTDRKIVTGADLIKRATA